MDRLYSVLETTWGYMAAVWSDRGLWELSFPRHDVAAAVAEAHATDLAEAHGHRLVPELKNELRRYFQGFPVEFGVPVDWRGYTPFRQAALAYTARIPYGQVETYGNIAAAIGHSGAARAVGGAMHSNRTPIVVPCHRVIGAGGSLTGFGGGLDMKQALLLLERGG